MTNTNLMIVFWNLGIGGVQRKILDIVKYLGSQRGYRNLKVHLVLRDKRPFSLGENEKLPQTYIHYFPDSIKNASRFLFPLYILWKLLLIKPDTVLTFLHMASIYSIATTRVVFWRNTRVILNEDILTSPDVQSKTKRRLIELLYPLADRIISPTTASKNDLVKYFKLISKKIIVIPNWTVMKDRNPERHEKFDLLFVGRFTKQKNISLLMHVSKQLIGLHPDIKVCLVGEGEEQEFIEESVKKEGLGANISIIKPTANIRKYLLRSKIFVLTSHYEGMPIALLEAKALGIPAVVTSYPGAEEAVDNGKDGYICNTNIEFVERVHQILSDETLRGKLGKCALKRSRKEFSTSALRKFLTNILEAMKEVV